MESFDQKKDDALGPLVHPGQQEQVSKAATPTAPHTVNVPFDLQPNILVPIGSNQSPVIIASEGTKEVLGTPAKEDKEMTLVLKPSPEEFTVSPARAATQAPAVQDLPPPELDNDLLSVMESDENAQHVMIKLQHEIDCLEREATNVAKEVKELRWKERNFARDHIELVEDLKVQLATNKDYLRSVNYRQLQVENEHRRLITGICRDIDVGEQALASCISQNGEKKELLASRARRDKIENARYVISKNERLKRSLDLWTAQDKQLTEQLSIRKRLLALVEEGSQKAIVHLLLRTMETYKQYVKLQEEACASLLHLFVLPECVWAFGAKEGISQVIQTMDRHNDHLGLQTTASRLLWKYLSVAPTEEASRANDGNRILAVELRAIRRHPPTRAHRLFYNALAALKLLLPSDYVVEDQQKCLMNNYLARRSMGRIKTFRKGKSAGAAPPQESSQIEKKPSPVDLSELDKVLGDSVVHVEEGDSDDEEDQDLLQRQMEESAQAAHNIENLTSGKPGEAEKLPELESPEGSVISTELSVLLGFLRLMPHEDLFITESICIVLGDAVRAGHTIGTLLDQEENVKVIVQLLSTSHPNNQILRSLCTFLLFWLFECVSEVQKQARLNKLHGCSVLDILLGHIRSGVKGTERAEKEGPTYEQQSTLLPEHELLQLLQDSPIAVFPALSLPSLPSMGLASPKSSVKPDLLRLDKDDSFALPEIHSMKNNLGSL